jgi:hypothetical protein
MVSQRKTRGCYQSIAPMSKPIANSLRYYYSKRGKIQAIAATKPVTHGVTSATDATFAARATRSPSFTIGDIIAIANDLGALRVIYSFT